MLDANSGGVRYFCSLGIFILTPALGSGRRVAESFYTRVSAEY
jgi:hypothetical protein